MPGMYLRECLIENVGPIAALDMSFELGSSGNPKPIILVGKNGTGKTILLAYILDALAELAKGKFQDIVLDQRLGHNPFLKIASGGDSRARGSGHVCLLDFSDAEKVFTYVERVGTLDSDQFTVRRKGRFEAVAQWPKDEPFHKQATGDAKRIESFFQTGSICFFPASRHERPHWLNTAAVTDYPLFSDSDRMQGLLGKPLVVESSAYDNRRWLMDVLLDSLVEVNFQPTSTSHPDIAHQYTYTLPSNLGDKPLLQQSRRNVEQLIRNILEDPNAQLSLNYRNAPFGRVAIGCGNGVTIPSFSHLSAGQALLFNLFATIIRYSDHRDLRKSIQLDDIEGIVLIDEVDAHLHTDLQYEVLPRLIRLFPKVQFIVTSHAPLFLLGMEQEFGEDGIQILEMPTGRRIGTERFEEFRRSFECYRNTRAFEETVEEQVLATTKPLVLTEGQTDVSYIRTALELLGYNDLLEQLEFDQVGKPGKEGSKGGGHNSLDAARKFLEQNQSRFPRRVLLLYDCDTIKPAETVGALMIRSVPNNTTNLKVTKGIENLLPEVLFEPRFYSRKAKPTGDGGETLISEFQKTAFCDWVCQERRDRENYKQFDQLLVPILREFLAAGVKG